jgi:heat shock protein HslJ/chitodextrinase
MKPDKQSPGRSRAIQWIGILLTFVILLSACRPAPTTPEPPAPPTEPPAPTVAEPVAVEETEEVAPANDLAAQLMDKSWLLVAYGDPANLTVVEEGTVVTALFSSDGNLSGSGGCNNYSTTYQLSGDQLTVASPMAVTMMFCEKGMDQEAAVLAGLERATRIAFTPEGRLEVFFDVGSGVEQKLVYAPGETPLVDTVWVLLSMGAPDSPTNVETGTIVTAIFAEDGVLSGTAGCNNYSAGYTAKDGLIEVQQPISTLRACTQGMEQEAAYLAALTAAETYKITGTRLEIQYNGGQGVLVYTSRNLTIENTLWTLVMVNGVPNTIGLVPTTALFDPGSEPGKGAVGGVAMCNNYRGSYAIEADALTIDGIAATKIRCPDTVMQAEATYLELLETAQTYQVFGQTLTIISETGSLIFVANRAPLEGTHWRLNSLGAADSPQAPVQGADFTALFVRQEGAPSGVIVGATGCNDYNATYVANLNEIKVNMPARTNNPGCAPGLPEQEQQYFLALNAATSYRILGDNLQIFYGDGNVLSFTAFVPETTPPPSGGPLTVLNGTRWWLISMANRTLSPGTQITAEFSINSDGATGTIFGFAGCNTYNAAIQSVFRIGPTASTKKFCAEPPGVMQQESAYLAMLPTANSFSLAYNQLIIGTAGGLLVYYGSPAAVIPIPTPTATSVPPATPTPEQATPQPTEEATPGVTPEPTTEPTPEPTLEPTPEPTEEPEPTAPPPPVAVISAPAEGEMAQPITFDASASMSESKIESYTWTFGDGTIIEGVTVQHAFIAPGIYTVTLTVIDTYGQTGTAEMTITIN